MKSKLVREIEDIIDLIEGLPLHNYEAPSAVQDVARALAEPSKGDTSDFTAMAAEIVWAGVTVPVPGGVKTPFSPRGYCYGQGILLQKSDRDKLIRCLRAVLLPGERGHPGRDKNDQLEKARADKASFETEVRLAKKQGRKDPKTQAYEKLEMQWNVGNRAARNRVYAARKLIACEDEEVPF
jgi:hypothetical protein